MDYSNLPKSEMWPRDDDFERVLMYLRVPSSDVDQIICVMGLFKPYILRIGFESDMDFLYLLNSVTTAIVHTAPDAREERAKSMIRALCDEEGLVCSIDQEEDEYIVHEDCAQELSAPVSSRHPDCDPTVCSTSVPCDLCQSFDNDASEVVIDVTKDVIPHPSIGELSSEEFDIDTLCVKFSELKIPVKIGESVASTPCLSPSARRRLRRRKQREFFDHCNISSVRVDSKKKRPSAPDIDQKRMVDNQHIYNQSPSYFPFFNFVSNMADVDWLQSRGVSDKIRLMTARLKEVNQS